MKNILRFFKKYAAWVVLVVLLLIGQAYCDLALPTYTADVLNVGLQQNGIENGVLDSISSDSLQTLELFISDSDVASVEEAYSEADANGIRYLKDDADTESLNDILIDPECIVYILNNAGAMTEATGSEVQMPSLDDIKAAVAAGITTKEQITQSMSEYVSQLDSLSDTYKKQLAVTYVSNEYTAQGLDLSEIQNDYLWDIGMTMGIIALAMMIISVLTNLVSAVISAKIGLDLRHQLYTKVMSFTGRETEKFSTASLITRSTNDIQQVQFVCVMILKMVTYAPILAIGGIIKVVSTTTQMGWLIIVAVIVLLGTIGVLGAIAMPKFKIMQKLVDNVNLKAREMLTGIMPIRAFSRQDYEEDKFNDANTELFKTQLFTNRVMTFMMPIMTLVMNGVSVFIVWVGAHKIDNGVMQIGEMTAFITYSMVIISSFLILAVVAIIVPRAAVAADRIAEVLDTEPVLIDPAFPEDAKLSDPVGNVEFKNVSFHYPDAEEDTISDISFVAEAGKTTAIVGSTGCGKSTVLNLIPRFQDVTGGSIMIDGVDIRCMTQHKLRSMMGYVPQKGVLFSGTIESNIKYGDESLSAEQVAEAAEVAQATEFIEDKEDRYSSTIAQGGTNVSGGQKQRLAIARAVAIDPKIYLFDDSFSALDFKTDLALRKALNEKSKGSTVIIVAQRISTILHADQIVVLEEGKLVGKGTHEELLKNCETYLEIAKSQLSEKELGLEGGAV